MCHPVVVQKMTIACKRARPFFLATGWVGDLATSESTVTTECLTYVGAPSSDKKETCGSLCQPSDVQVLRSVHTYCKSYQMVWVRPGTKDFLRKESECHVGACYQTLRGLLLKIDKSR